MQVYVYYKKMYKKIFNLNFVTLSIYVSTKNFIYMDDLCHLHTI